MGRKTAEYKSQHSDQVKRSSRVYRQLTFAAFLACRGAQSCPGVQSIREAANRSEQPLGQGDADQISQQIAEGLQQRAICGRSPRTGLLRQHYLQASKLTGAKRVLTHGCQARTAGACHVKTSLIEGGGGARANDGGKYRMDFAPSPGSRLSDPLGICRDRCQVRDLRLNSYSLTLH